MTNAALAVLKVLCSLVSVCLFLSPIPRMRQVVRNQHTGETPLLPLVCMFFNYICWFLHGLFIGDYFPLAATSVVGFTPGIVYTCIWIKFTPDRSYAFKTVGIAVVLLGLVLLYAVLAWQGVLFNQTNAQIGDVTGYIAVAATVAFYSSPLATIRKVLSTKSSESLIIQMIVMAVANNGLWSIYAALVSDWLLLAPNAVSFCLGLLQIYLCIKFPNKQQQRLSVDSDVAVVILPKEERQNEAALSSPTYELTMSPRLTPIHSNAHRVE